jgi:hypothetical protein
MDYGLRVFNELKYTIISGDTGHGFGGKIVFFY